MMYTVYQLLIALFPMLPFPYMIIFTQIALGFIYLMAGAMKVFMQGKARTMMSALTDYPVWFVMFIGLAEMAGAFGITLPLWSGAVPGLATLAALGLTLIMLGAMYTHLRRKEFPQFMMAFVFLIGLVFLAVQGF